MERVHSQVDRAELQRAALEQEVPAVALSTLLVFLHPRRPALAG